MLLTRPEGLEITDKAHCRKCGSALRRGERVRPAWIVVGTIKHPKTGKPDLVLASRMDMAAPQNEYFHAHCLDTKLSDVATILLAERIPVDGEMPEIRPRGDDAHCIKCNKAYARADRVTLAYIVQGVGRDPETNALAAKVGGEYETQHVSCEDPKLSFGSGGSTPDIISVS